MENKKFYITTAIAYTSRIPHIGNTYEAVLADSIARYKRLCGYDVFFLTGTDEHGQKIQKLAESLNRTPKEHVDEISSEIKRIWDMMNVSYDKFIRTTDDYHIDIVQNIFNKLYDKGDIYKSKYEGLYCLPCESFFTESQVTDGKCPDCGHTLERASEEAYFFKLSKYTDRLIKYIEENPGFIQPESRKNEMINNFLKPGLSDLCVSRTSFDWGIPVTIDEKHVIYVWIDALSNYITALGYNPEGESGELFKRYWPCDVHLIGKDILRFHTIYWPIMLMALDVELPEQIFGHPWLLFGEDKMSKSKGNVIYADDLVKFFGVDAVRYFLLHEMPFAQDGAITYELMISRINSDLVNILGNLVNRTVAMINKYFNSIIPAPSCIEDKDKELIELAKATPSKVEAKMNDLRVADALDKIWTLLRRTNKYIDETTPWILAKDKSSSERLGTVLYNLAESIRISAVLLSAYLPETAEKIFNLLNVQKRDFSSLTGFDGTVAGTKIGAAELLFARIDEKEKLQEIENILNHADNDNGSNTASDTGDGLAIIGIDDFSKVELRVARVLECVSVEKSNKLLKLILDDGTGRRQVVSGISKWYKPEDLVNRNIILVANLKPVKLRGVESQGMILAADHEDTARVIFVDDDIPAGSKIR